MRHGSSGAYIELQSESAVKATLNLRDERIALQGAWLQRHASPVTPRVFAVYSKSYRMERLVAPPLVALNHRYVLSEMLERLTTYVWSQPPVVQYDLTETCDKIYALTCNMTQRTVITPVLKRLDELGEQISWSTLIAVLTHGDPTFDNVMFRESTGELVLIDPIPATPAVPDLRAVDLGKVLQSVLGYEEVRYSDPAQRLQLTPLDVQAYVSDDNEWRAVVFWCVVHLLRALPYMPTADICTQLIGLINDAFAAL